MLDNILYKCTREQIISVFLGDCGFAHDDVDKHSNGFPLGEIRFDAKDLWALKVKGSRI